MKNNNHKSSWNIITIAVTAVLLMGLVSTASAQVTNPTSSTVVEWGDNLTITWSGIAPTVDIVLFQRGYPRMWIAQGVSSSSYNWTVPTTTYPDDAYQVRVVEADVYPVDPPANKYDDSPMFTILCDCPEDENVD